MTAAAGPPIPSPPADARRRLRRVAGGALVLAVVLLSLWWFWWKPDPPSPPTIDSRGVDPRVVEAIEVARRGVAQAPDSAAAWGRLGLVLRAHDYGGEANICFAQAEKLDPKNPRWPYHQGAVLIITDPDAGLACLRRASDLSGSVTAPTLLLAEVLMSRGNTDEAEALFRRVLRTEEKNPRAHHGLGRIAFARGDLPACRQHLAVSVEMAPWIQGTHALLAELHYAQGNRVAAEEERAIADRLPLVAAWPDEYMEEVSQLRVGIESRLAEVSQLLQQNRVRDALVVSQNTVNLYPESYDAVLALGKTNLRLQPPDYPAAERAFRDAVRLRSDDPAGHYHLGIALEQQRRFQAAADSYAKATTLKPDYAAAHYNRGQCLRQLDDLPGALDAFQNAVRTKPNFPEARRELGDMLARQNRDAEALAQLEQAAQLAPRDPSIQKLLDEVRKRLPPKK